MHETHSVSCLVPAEGVDYLAYRFERRPWRINVHHASSVETEGRGRLGFALASVRGPWSAHGGRDDGTFDFM